MGDLSHHFSRHEFECRCGCGFDTVDARTLQICEEVRRFTGELVYVTSGARCKTHNKAVGGALDSQHLVGRAADLVVADPTTVYRWLLKRYPDRFGFGVYGYFVHVDSRLECARWIRYPGLGAER
jgi:uncharacterized protein YcbK (DUF882 family)